MQCPNHPDVKLQWLTERNWFFRLSAYQERLLDHYEQHPDFVQPDYRRNEMLGFIRQGLEDFSISRADATWGIPFPIGEDGQTAQREDGSWDREAGTIYVWFDALINYITGAGLPGRPEAFAHWWPADLHVIGKDIARFHTIYWPAMLWSAGIEAPRHVWVHGFMTVRGEKMSKSRGNFLDPAAMVAAFGADGTRFVTLREIPFDHDADVSWDSFVRRYNADLANDFGNLVNRTVTMVNRYLDGERPAPRAAGDSPAGRGLGRHARAVPGAARGLPPARRPGASCGSSSAAPTRRSTPSSRGRSTRRPRRATPRRRPGCARCWATSWRRAGWSASRSRRSCRRSRRASSSSWASPTATRPTATAGRRSSSDLAWGAATAPGQVIDTPTPLFPRIESEAAEAQPA